MNGYRAKARVGHRIDVEVRCITEEYPGHRDRARRGAERRDSDPCVESAHQFLQDKYSPRDGSVKCRSKSGSRAGGQKRFAVIFMAAKDLSYQMGSTRPHLHARSFAAERQAGTDCEHTTDELHGYEAVRCLGQLSAKDRLDVGGCRCGLPAVSIGELAKLQCQSQPRKWR